MVVRSVEIEQAYLKLSRRNYPASLSTARLKLIGIDGAALDVEAQFGKGISVITGGNGAGKTTLLRALDSVIRLGLGEEPQDWPTRLLEVEIRGTNNGSDWSVLATRAHADLDFAAPLATGELPGGLTFIDPARETQDLIGRLSGDSNLGDLLSGLDPAPMNDRWRKMLSFVLRRDYEEVLCYEVPSLRADDEPVPLFEMRIGGAVYGTLQMGRGELSATYLIWKLSRLPAGAVVIVEEPENHLAAFSQGALMDVLAICSADDGLTFVVSSHSPEMFQKLADGQVVFVASLPAMAIRNGLSSVHVAKELGLRLPIRVLTVVEDLIAGLVLAALTRRLEPTLLDGLEIVFSSDGESGVRRAVADIQSSGSFKPGAIPLALVGILDGDQRSVGDPFLFLPGGDGPELSLKRIAMSWISAHSHTVSAGSAQEAILNSLGAVAGLDDHDWIHQIAATVGGLPLAVDALVEMALGDEAFRIEADLLVAGLRSRVLV